MKSNRIDSKWFSIIIPVILIVSSIGIYYLILSPNSTGDPGGVEGVITDELGRGIGGLRVIIIDGSVGFPEIAAMTNEDGYYQIGSIPLGTFTIEVHARARCALTCIMSVNHNLRNIS